MPEPENPPSGSYLTDSVVQEIARFMLLIRAIRFAGAIIAYPIKKIYTTILRQGR